MSKPFLLSVAAVAVASASAAASAPATLGNAVYREVETRGPDGRIGVRLEPAAKILPGEQVVYVLTYRNVGARPTQGVVVSNPLPAGVEYAGPREGVPPEVSVDGGRTFGALADLHGPAAPATFSDVTALRWTIPGIVPPDGEIRLSYRARLK